MEEHHHHNHPAHQPAPPAMPAGHQHAGHATSPAAPGPAHDHSGHSGHGDMVADFTRRLYISVGLSLGVFASAPPLQLAFATALFLYGGWPFLKGLADELGGRRPGMMTLIATAITAAYFYSALTVFRPGGDSFFWELATLIDIMLLGHLVEMKAVRKASGALEALAGLLPAVAHRLAADGSLTDVPLAAIAKGWRLLVRPGEKVPADGLVAKGETTVNEAMLTGESRPVFKKAGSAVIGGSVNGDGAIEVSVARTGQESFLAQVAGLVAAAQASKSHTQDLANRAAFWLTIIALASGAATLYLWLGPGQQDFAFALERAVTVLVISCPHALGLAVPLVVAVSTSLAAGSGLLIRNRAAFEQARNLGAIIFDKTGTLTAGKFSVTAVISLDDAFPREEVLRYAASLETASEHSIARGIVAAAGQTYGVEGFAAVPGKGAAGLVNGRAVKIASPGYLEELGLTPPENMPAETAGQTVVYLVIDGRLTGAIALADGLRPEAKEAVAALQGMGIRCIMLTGDSRAVAWQVAAAAGIDEYIAEVLPADKAAKVSEIQSRGLTVGMVGDGINDAPALAQADVGIAVGAGTDVAVAAADIVLVRDNLLDVVAIIGLAKATYAKMAQNLLWATGYNLVAIPLAAGLLAGTGLIMTPAMGAVLMSASTVIVAANAGLLARGFKK